MTAKHYFVVMIDYGRKGMEAVTDPNITRRSMIDRIVTGEDDIETIAWVHEIDDPGDGQRIVTTDITHEVLSEARNLIERKNDFRLEAAE